MCPAKTALVLGATGGIGGAVAAQLRAHNWTVRALHRNPAQAASQADGLHWIAGDAMRRDDVVAAAAGVDVIFHGVNPPGYRNWAQLVLPMIDNTVAAAKASDARVVMPGTIYNYGPDAFPLLREDAPQRPRTHKGAIRVAKEQRLEAAAADGVPSLIVRAGDFFGPAAANNWFSQGLVKPGQPLSAITDPGESGVGHAWAYLPDLAACFMQLIASGPASAFERFHFAGHWDPDGTAMIAAIRAAAKAPRLPVRKLPWSLLMLASPFVPFLREMREMRYLWQEPLRLDNTALIARLGEEPHTPLVDAVTETLISLGCLDAARGQSRAA